MRKDSEMLEEETCKNLYKKYFASFVISHDIHLVLFIFQLSNYGSLSYFLSNCLHDILSHQYGFSRNDYGFLLVKKLS